MSDILRLNGNTKKIKVRIQNPLFDDIQSEEQKEEDYIQTNLQNYYDRGFNEGMESAKEELLKGFEAKQKKLTERLDSVIKEVNEKLNDYDKLFEPLVLELAFAIAEKITKSELSNKSIIQQTLEDSLKKVIGSNNIVVKLNPDDLKLINENSSDILQSGNLSKIKFEPDQGIEPGGCFVETEIGNVDARISTRLDELKKRLEEAIAK